MKRIDDCFDRANKQAGWRDREIHQRFDRLDKLMTLITRFLFTTLIPVLAGAAMFIFDGALWATRF